MADFLFGPVVFLHLLSKTVRNIDEDNLFSERGIFFAWSDVDFIL